MTDNEVSKIGHHDDHADHHDDDAVIEGRIVGAYEGPFMWTESLREFQKHWDEMVRERIRQETSAREEWLESFLFPKTQPTSYHYFVDAHGIRDGATLPNNSWAEGWADEIRSWRPESVTVEFAWDDIDPEAFRLMTGYDKEVLVAAGKIDDKVPVPEVNPDAVTWRVPRAKRPPRWDWLT